MAKPTGVARGLATAALCAWLAACGRPGTPSQPTELNPESRLRVGEAAERTGDMETAISMYTAAADGAPDDSAVQVRAASGLARAGKWNQARDLLVARVKAHPKDPDLLRTLAAIYVMVGQPRTAISRFDELLAAAPADIGATVDKAVALDLQGQHAEAQALYRRAQARAPQDPVIANNLALSLLMSGQPQEALAALSQFAEADEVPDRLKINLGIILAANGQRDRALRLLEGRVTPADLDAMTQALRSGRPPIPNTP